MKTYCLTLDLKDDPETIKTYDSYHRSVWPEIEASFIAAGILEMQIYRAHNRLFMIIETTPEFSFAAKAAADSASSKVQEWEQLMERFQQRIPWAKPEEKWVLLEKIYQLGKNQPV